MRLWATGVVPYASDAEVLGSRHLLAWNVFWVMVVPLWRDLHFYVAHRFVHIRAIYRFVHSLHHRNADPEPFSGMTMHPIEHLCTPQHTQGSNLRARGSNPRLAAHLATHACGPCRGQTTSPTPSCPCCTSRASRRSSSFGCTYTWRSHQARGTAAGRTTSR